MPSYFQIYWGVEYSRGDGGEKEELDKMVKN